MNATAHDVAETLPSEIRALTGLNPARCYQCGKCSAGCPMAGEMRLRPHDVMRLAMRGERDQIFADESIWLCLTCETCSSRCPQKVEPARIIDALREIGRREGREAAPRAVSAFHRAFLDQIKGRGRIHEVGLVVAYKTRSLDLFSDAASAPGMFLRGKLPLAGEKVRGMDDVRRIFAACLEGERR